jgi:hypothetical protein
MESAEVPRTLPGAAFLRAEDVLLTVCVAIAAPLLVAGGSFRMLDTGHPLEGAVILASLAAALLCFVTTAPGTERRPIGGYVGPLTGGVMLVGASGFSSLSLPDGWALPIVVAGVAAVLVLRLRYPVLSSPTRRALVTPFVLVSGSIFWSVVEAVIRPSGASGVTAKQLRDALVDNAPGVGAFGLVLLAAAAVYYAMLVYAPRQVADTEGSGPAWLVRFGLFVVSVLFGVGWINALGLA